MPTMSVSKDDDCIQVELDVELDEIGPIESMVDQFEDRMTDVIEAVLETGLEAKLERDLGPKYGTDNNEITGDTNRFLTNQLKELVWEDEWDESNYRVQLIQWARRYETFAPHTAGHVCPAVEGLVKTRRYELQTTSLAEREMREINKRFENGGGWTEHGGKAMIRHHQMLRQKAG